MLTITLDPFKQLAIQRPVESAARPPARPLSAGFGLLAERPVEFYTKLSPEFSIRGLCPSWLTLHDAAIISPARPAEHTPPERGAVPFVMAVRGLIEAERLAAAREMLAAAPTHILTDPLVARLRSILSPPVVKRGQKRDVDRTREYEWLGTDGHKYRGRWVALDGNRLLAVASSLRELREQLKPVAFTHPPLLHRVD